MKIIKQPPKKLYHYTTQSGLLGIVDENAIWTTKIHYLNDSTEYKLAGDIVLDELKKKKERARSEITIVLCDHFIEEINSMSELNICVCSFSENRDLLSQWRGYCGGVGGYSLGFSTSNLINESNKQNFILSPCVYEENEQRKLLNNLIVNGLRSIKRKMTKSDLDNPERLGSLAVDFCKKFAVLAPIIKNKNFGEEKEWRLISKWGIWAERFSFRPGLTTITPYYKFSLGKSPKKYLKEIVIGPNPHPKLAKDAMWILLRKKESDHKITILHSEIPYRNV